MPVPPLVSLNLLLFSKTKQHKKEESNKYLFSEILDSVFDTSKTKPQKEFETNIPNL